DLPGFGLTAAGGRRHTVAANVGVLNRLLELLDSAPAVVMGNSMGALIALGAAGERPDRCAALVLVDPALPAAPRQRLRADAIARNFLLTYAMPWIGARRLRRIAAKHGPEPIVRDMLNLCCVDAGRIDPAVVTAHVELERRRMEQAGWDAPFFAASRSLVNMLAVRRRVERWIERITVPTLLVHGRRDRLISVHSARQAAALRPDWEYCEMDDVGHVPMMEAPREFLDVTCGWLQRTLAAQPRRTAPQPVSNLSRRRLPAAAGPRARCGASTPPPCG
ncbi:MAG: alpha/beta hydrolase, partial [Solirubrobacterales bacterium]|nr:alpha/beta hydrolase [Solirubrobacterales bacterium]